MAQLSSQQPAEPLTLAPPVTRRRSRIARTEELWGYLFISPWLLGFLIFTLGPMLVSLYWSFTRYEFPISPRWVGAANYVKAVSSDELFPKSLGNTTYYVLAAVPLGLILSLLLALLLDRKIRGRAIWRTVYYVPSIVPAVVTAFLFDILYLFSHLLYQYFELDGGLCDIGVNRF